MPGQRPCILSATFHSLNFLGWTNSFIFQDNFYIYGGSATKDIYVLNLSKKFENIQVWNNS